MSDDRIDVTLLRRQNADLGRSLEQSAAHARDLYMQNAALQKRVEELEKAAEPPEDPEVKIALLTDEIAATILADENQLDEWRKHAWADRDLGKLMWEHINNDAPLWPAGWPEGVDPKAHVSLHVRPMARLRVEAEAARREPASKTPETRMHATLRGDG